MQTRLQSACDAGTLAGRRAVGANGFDATAREQADIYFHANFDAERQGVSEPGFVASSADKGSTINGVATASLPPLMMQLFGFDGFELRTTCTASMEVGNSDVMMVLDTTGSMAWTLAGSTQTRIQALQAAMKNFYDTLASSTSGTNARVRYGFVPYSSSVNVGRLIHDLDPDYLVDSRVIQSRLPIYRTVNTVTGHGAPTNSAGSYTTNPTYSGWANYNSTTYYSSSSCNGAKPADTPWANSGAPTTSTTTITNGANQLVTTTSVTQTQTATFYRCDGFLFIRLQSRIGTRQVVTTATSTQDPIYAQTQVFSRWEYRPVTYDTSEYKLFEAVSTNTGENAAAVSSTWGGCIEERSTVSEPAFSWSALGGFTPAGAEDLDIDTAPDGTDATRWSPMWPEVAYIRTVNYGGVTYMNDAMPSPTGQQAPSFCPSPAQLPTAMSRGAFFEYADGLVAEGATYHDIGLVWGARLFSPSGLWSGNVLDAPTNGGEVGRHMIFMTDGEMSPSYSIQSSWGIEYHDRRVTDNGVDGDAARHNSRFLALCEAVKAKGIRLWVIAFAADMTTELSTCASSDSAFTAANAAQLEESFQSIARQVGELRIVQ